MKLQAIIIAMGAGIALVGCKQGPSAEVALKTKEDSVAYAVGADMGMGMKEQGIELPAEAIYAGIMGGQDTTKLKLTQEEMGKVMMAFQMEMRKKAQEKAQEKLGSPEENAKKSEAFIAAKKAEAGVKTTESGLIYKVVKSGTGASPKDGSKVKVHYTGKFPDGKVFDSSVERGQPADMVVGQMVPGFNEALKLMKVGDKIEAYLKPELAYGPMGAGDRIGANQALTFEIELLEVGAQANTAVPQH